MSTKPPGPPPRRFENHNSHGFIEFVRGQIHKACSDFPTHVYHVRQAEVQLEERARQVIVECLIAEFPDMISVPQVTREWPVADCMIDATRTTARIRVSWSPETDAILNGSPVDAIDFPVKQAPPSLGRRMVNKILNAIPGKRVGDPEMAPTGTPDGKRAITKSQDPHRSGANLKAATGPDLKRAEPQKPVGKPRPTR